MQTGRRGPVNLDDSPDPGESAHVTYLPSYWAGYAHRTAFYARDFVHQATAAQLLGLERENLTMLRTFANSATAERKWFPLWAFNFDGSAFATDYRGDDDFVREIPAVFELVELTARLYRWTGDANYLGDDLWRYCSRSVSSFIRAHDTVIPNGIAEGTGQGIFQGTASYDEGPGAAVIESGDGIAAQYAAFQGYAALAAARGEREIAGEYAAKADALAAMFNTEWGVTPDQFEYVRARDASGQALLGFGREASVFPALKGLIDPDSARTAAFVHWLDRMHHAHRPPNIESLTYLPEALFRYGLDAEAYGWMREIIASLFLPHHVRAQGLNGDYPETAFTLVSQVVEGLAGVAPDAPNHAVTLCSHLPPELRWVDVRGIRIGGGEINVRHDGTTVSTLELVRGATPLMVTAQFPGARAHIGVNGHVKTARAVRSGGRDLSEVRVQVHPGERVSFVAVGALPDLASPPD